MSKIDPIFVYNKHQSSVSALCFGNFYNQPIIVTGSNDGELHIWELVNFTTLIKIQVHQHKILNLENFEFYSKQINIYDNKSTIDNTNNSTTIDNKSIDSSNLTKYEQTIDNKSRYELNFLSQDKNGIMKFICLFKENNEIKFKIKNNLRCSNSTFCQFKRLQILNYQILIFISTQSNNCINLVVFMNESIDNYILNCKIIELDKNYGMINSMKIDYYLDNYLILLIGTETGHLFIYTSKFNFIKNNLDLINNDNLLNNLIDLKINNLNQLLIYKFNLNFKLECFKDSYISSIELINNKSNLKIICGSVEDCLAIIELKLNSNTIQLINDQSIKYLKLTNKGINSIEKRLDNKLFATCGWDFKIRLFSLKSFNALAVLNFHKQSIEMIKFSNQIPNKGYLLAAVSDDKLVTLWSIYN